MSLRSDPKVTPESPDPVTRNQPNPENINSGESTGTVAMPGNYPRSPKDTTSSGGYSAPPESVWSNKSQRGTEEPVHSEAGLIEQSTDGTRLDNELQDAKQGRDKNHSS